MTSKPLQAGNNGVTPDGVIPHTFYDGNGLDGSSCNSTPYTSAPSSPGRQPPAPIGYFYSAPSSPMHFFKSSTSSSSSTAADAARCSNAAAVDFEFGLFSGPPEEADDDRSSVMSSADELFLNGQIRPMKLSSHLQRPQILPPLIDVDEEDEEENQSAEIEVVRGRDFKKMRDRSLRRKARSLSPLRTDWNNDLEDGNDHHRDKQYEAEERKIGIGANVDDASSSSSSSSGGRNSKRWVFLKDFMRSKSDGSNSGSRHATRFWSSISFSSTKSASSNHKSDISQKAKLNEEFPQTVGARASGGDGSSRARNAIGKRRSAHEAHYAAKRAQAEEMRRKTFLPYRQGLLGCLRFSSKGYGAMNGFAKSLNSVS